MAKKYYWDDDVDAIVGIEMPEEEPVQHLVRASDWGDSSMYINGSLWHVHKDVLDELDRLNALVEELTEKG